MSLSCSNKKKGSSRGSPVRGKRQAETDTEERRREATEKPAQTKQRAVRRKPRAPIFLRLPFFSHAHSNRHSSCVRTHAHTTLSHILGFLTFVYSDQLIAAYSRGSHVVRRAPTATARRGGSPPRWQHSSAGSFGYTRKLHTAAIYILRCQNALLVPSDDDDDDAAGAGDAAAAVAAVVTATATATASCAPTRRNVLYGGRDMC